MKAGLWFAMLSFYLVGQPRLGGGLYFRVFSDAKIWRDGWDILIKTNPKDSAMMQDVMSKVDAFMGKW